MKRFIGIALAVAATVAITIVLNVTLIAGYPWGDKLLGH